MKDMPPTEHWNLYDPSVTPKRSKLPLVITLGGFLLLMIWIAVSATRIARAVSSINENSERAQILLDQGLLQADADEAESLILETHYDIQSLNSALGPLLRVAPLFSWLPKVGALLENSPYLMEMADTGSQAAIHMMAALKPALVLIQQQEGSALSSMPQVLEIIEAGKGELNLANQKMTGVVNARQNIRSEDELPLQIQDSLAFFDENISFMTDGLALMPLLPDVLGIEEQKRYLILAQNEDELRATGGFISGAGLLTVEDGLIVSISFENANGVDDWQNKPYDLPPEPFREFMGMDIFLFRDANFWPSFPLTAEQAMQLYSYGQNIPLDGVVAIDQRFLEMLLTAVGPVEVPELASLLNAGNVVAELRRAWGPEAGTADWIDVRKAFMGPLSSAILLALESNASSINIFELSRIVQNAIDRRHLQFYITEPIIANVFQEAGWDGRQENTLGQDFLLVVDSNLGFNKANAAVTRNVSYSVSLDELGSGTGEVLVSYEHTGTAHDTFCSHGTTYSETTRYADLINDCYWDYLRVYVPAGSSLLSATEHPVSSESLMSGQPWNGIARTITEPGNELVTFDNFLLLEPGKQVTTSFRYLLPSSITRRENNHKVYRLSVNKQAGVQSQMLRVSILLPPESQLKQASPEPTAVTGHEILFVAAQDTDLTFEIEFEQDG